MFARRSALLLMVFVVSGCGVISQIEPEVDVNALAETWPPYQTPQVRVDQPRLSGNDVQSRPQQLVATDHHRSGFNTIPYQEWNLPTAAIDALGRMGRGAVPPLVDTLDNPDPAKRIQAARMLARIGPDADRAVDKLTDLLNDPSLDVRRAAIRALGQIGPAADTAINPLMEIIENDLPPSQTQPTR